LQLRPLGRRGDVRQQLVQLDLDLVDLGRQHHVSSTTSGGSTTSSTTSSTSGGSTTTSSTSGGSTTTSSSTGGTDVPEPGMLGLMGAGLAGLAFVRRRRR
jgi:hypothetical protein